MSEAEQAREPQRDKNGRLLAGRYRLGEVLGRGGMGTVWRADDETLGRTVAVKELRFPSAIDEDEKRRLITRTLREAKAIARIRNNSAVTVYDVVDEDDRPWIVMELIEGKSLAEAIREDGTLTPKRAAEVGLAILDVLRSAHREGILHRDVKPSNVLIAEDGRVVLTDFGIAQVEGDPSVTSTGMLVGAPSYISPERARGHKPGPPADLWSLGGLLYASVEGCPPYDKGSAIATLTAVMTEPLDPPKNAGPLTEVIYGLLARDPNSVSTTPERGRCSTTSSTPPTCPRPPPRTRRRSWPSRRPPPPTPRQAGAEAAQGPEAAEAVQRNGRVRRRRPRPAARRPAVRAQREDAGGGRRSRRGCRGGVHGLSRCRGHGLARRPAQAAVPARDSGPGREVRGGVRVRSPAGARGAVAAPAASAGAVKSAAAANASVPGQRPPSSTASTRASITDVVPRRTLAIIASRRRAGHPRHDLAIALGGDDADKGGKGDAAASAGASTGGADDKGEDTGGGSSGGKGDGQKEGQGREDGRASEGPSGEGSDAPKGDDSEGDGGDKPGDSLPAGYEKVTDARFHFTMAMPRTSGAPPSRAPTPEASTTPDRAASPGSRSTSTARPRTMPRPPGAGPSPAPRFSATATSTAA